MDLTVPKFVRSLPSPSWGAVPVGELGQDAVPEAREDGGRGAG